MAHIFRLTSYFKEKYLRLSPSERSVYYISSFWLSSFTIGIVTYARLSQTLYSRHGYLSLAKTEASERLSTGQPLQFLTPQKASIDSGGVFAAAELPLIGSNLAGKLLISARKKSVSKLEDEASRADISYFEHPNLIRRHFVEWLREQWQNSEEESPEKNWELESLVFVPAEAPDTFKVLLGDPRSNPRYEHAFGGTTTEEAELRSNLRIQLATVLMSAALVGLAFLLNRMWIIGRQNGAKRFMTNFLHKHQDIKKFLRTDYLNLLGMTGVMKPHYVDSFLHISTPQGLARLHIVGSRTSIRQPFMLSRATLMTQNGQEKRLKPLTSS